MDNIIVGMDTSPGAAAALRWAVLEADRRGGEVTAVLASSYLDRQRPPPFGSFDPAYGDDVRAALDVAVESAVGEDAARRVKRTVVSDLPAAGLLAASQDADLLVVGARGLGGLRALLLGSVSEQCLHHATCPVAVVHQSPILDEGARVGEPERIVVGIDGSESAQKALRWALDSARARGATVDAVHAWRPPAVGYGTIVPFDSPSIEGGARQILDRVIDAEDTHGLPTPIERVILIGPPAQVVLEAAKGADLVVLGSRGTGGFKGLLMGSVSHQVARHAPCPVVVVPGAAPKGT